MEMKNLTGAEKVLYKANYEFFLNVVKVSNECAHNEAINKIDKKRKLAKKVLRY